MLKNRITARYHRMVFKSCILMLAPMVVLGGAIFIYPEALRELLILAGMFLLLDMLLFSIVQKRFNGSIKGTKVIVTGLDDALPFPNRLRISQINTLKSNFNSYGYKNMQIPKSFIQSRVDHYYHLYPALDKINEVNDYKIIEVSALKFALIEDIHKKRWISSLHYLEEDQPLN